MRTPSPESLPESSEEEGDEYDEEDDWQGGDASGRSDGDSTAWEDEGDFEKEGSPHTLDAAAHRLHEEGTPEGDAAGESQLNQAAAEALIASEMAAVGTPHAPLDYDALLVVWGGATTSRRLPRPQARSERATDRRLLAPPLQSLADAVAPRRMLIECGGDGQCGPNALSYMLKLLGLFEGDGFALRRQIVQYVRGSDVLEHHTNFRWTLQPDSPLTCRDLMIENMKKWPREVIAGRGLSVDSWCEITASAEAWTDLTFVQLCSSKFSVIINVVGVRGTGEVQRMFPVEPTPRGTPATAECDLGCWLGTHFVAIVDVTQTHGEADKPTAGNEDGSQNDGGGQADDAEDSVHSKHEARPETKEASAGSHSVATDEAQVEAEETITPMEVQHLVNLLDATSATLVLIFVAVMVQPLVFAHVNGFTVMGMDLPRSTKRSEAMRCIQRLCDTMWSRRLYAFLVGRHAQGWHLFAAPADFSPPQAQVCRTASRRRRLALAGAGFAWFTLAALQGTPCGMAAAQAIMAARCFVTAPSELTAACFNDPAITPLTLDTGATRTASMLTIPPLADVGKPSARQALQRLLQQDLSLRDLLLEAVATEPSLEGWLERIQPAPIDEVPDHLLAQLPNFADASLDEVELPAPSLPYRLPWTELTPSQPTAPKGTPKCPKVKDLMLPHTQIKVKEWMDAQLSDLVSIRDQLQQGIAPEDVKRNRPAAIAVGQSEIQPWAKGIVWDCREVCCTPLNYTEPFSTDLNLPMIQRELGCYPDQTLLSYLLQGVRLEADVELQAVFVPHLVSLSLGFASVNKEIRRLQRAGWYDFFDQIPFFPIYLNGQGAVARKLEPDRFRRSTEGGGPRKETRDASGLPAISLNSAARIHHTPRHFAEDRRPLFREWLRTRPPAPYDRGARRAAPHCHGHAHTPWTKLADSIEPLLNEHSKFPQERKPLLIVLMIALAVLCRAAHVLDAPIYVFSDDAKDFFNQLGMAIPDLWKLGIAFLDDFDDMRQDAKLIFVSEKRLGFGTHGASNTAQRFSDALLTLFADRMDEEEARHDPASEHRAWSQWRASREKVQNRSKHPCTRTRRFAGTQEDRARGVLVCPQMRLWFALMYTDDPIFVVVGASRAIRALKVWRQLTAELQLIMAIPEKRALGSWANWLGIIIIAPLGLIVVPRHKLLRAATTIAQVVERGCPFHVYRALCGLLEHLRSVNLKGREVMHGLYGPHRADGVSRFGPNAKVQCSVLMKKQLLRWRSLVFHSGGSDVRLAIVATKRPQPPPITVILDSDACLGDAEPAGMGGYMHGHYWYFRVPREDYQWVTTPLLEFLAVCFNILTFHRTLLGGEGVILLRTDALATASSLPAATMKSETHMQAYQWLRRSNAWRDLAHRLAIKHLFGDSNVMGDAVSRARWAEFRARCAQLRVRPSQVAPAQSAIKLYQKVLAVARQNQVAVVSLNAHRAGGWLDNLVRSPHHEEAQIEDELPPTEPESRNWLANLVVRDGWMPQTPRLTKGASIDHTHSRVPPLTPQTTCIHNPRAHGNSLQTPLRRVIKGVHLPPRMNLSSTSLRPHLTSASTHMASQMTAEFTQGEAEMQFGLPKPQAAALAIAIQEGIDFGININTGQIDERAWVMWEHICAQYHTSPYRTAQEVRDHPQRNSHLLAALLMHAFAIGKPKDPTRQFIRPNSAMAYPRAIIRIFKRWQIVMPAQSTLRGSLAHLSRLYIAYHGPYSLSPRRAEPMKYSMVLKMNSVYAIDVDKIHWTDHHHDVFMFRRLNLVMWPTGFRLAEIVHHASNEIMYLTFESLTWSFNGVVEIEPSALQLQHMVAGRDYARLAPPRSKPDQWGEIHCPYPVVLTYFVEEGNAAAALRDLELHRLRNPNALPRTNAALFHDRAQQPYTHAFLDGMLKSILRHCYGAAVASLFTWHSYRSGLATALHAAGVPDDLIMLICRWMCPQSLHVYRRMGMEENERCTRRAMLAKVDLIQSTNVPKVVGDNGYAQLFAEHRVFAHVCQTSSAVLAGAAGVARATRTTEPASEERPQFPDTSNSAQRSSCVLVSPPRRAIAKPTHSPATLAQSRRRARRSRELRPAAPTPEVNRLTLRVSDVRHRFPATLAEIIPRNERPSTRPPPTDRYGVNRDGREQR